MQVWDNYLDPRSRWSGKEDKVWYARTGQLRLRIGIGGELQSKRGRQNIHRPRLIVDFLWQILGKA